MGPLQSNFVSNLVYSVVAYKCRKGTEKTNSESFPIEYDDKTNINLTTLN
jgi:hypothetical protein